MTELMGQSGNMTEGTVIVHQHIGVDIVSAAAGIGTGTLALVGIDIHRLLLQSSQVMQLQMHLELKFAKFQLKYQAPEKGGDLMEVRQQQVHHMSRHSAGN